MMVVTKRAFYVLSGLVLVMLMSACGGGGSTQSTSTSASTSAATPTTANSSNIQTAQVTLNGRATMILTNTRGLTLYYFTPDSANKLACSGGCAKAWPPLTFNGSGTPTSATSLPGSLSVLHDANGAQVEYAGYLLYTYSGDSAPGQVKGQGLFSKWYVATPDIAAFAVRIATASVKGKVEAILATPQGKTLYYFTPDSAAQAACIGGCAKAWPPLVSSGSGTTLADPALPGTMRLITDANGAQVAYNGHLLYTFAGDTAPGQTKGEGLGGKWFVCTPSLTSLAA
jgi:predicted lipoprotein with Yx(FWY)xxD motif